MLARSRQVLSRLAAAIGSVLEELAVATGAALVTVGLWPHLRVTALIVPGLVLLWIALPSRAAFVARPPEQPQRRKL